MPKRKRASSDASSTLIHALKSLNRSLKLAKGFERQKLSRRQKTASQSKNDTDLRRINAEIAALKDLELQAVAEHHLCKTLLRIKSVAAKLNEDEEAGLAEQVKKGAEKKLGAEDRAIANVVARLCNVRPVREALDEGIERMQTALGLNDDVDEGNADKKLKNDDGRSLPKTDRPSVEGDDRKASGDEDEWNGFDSGSIASHADSSSSPPTTSRVPTSNENDFSDGDDSETDKLYGALSRRIAASSDSDISFRSPSPPFSDLYPTDPRKIWSPISSDFEDMEPRPLRLNAKFPALKAEYDAAKTKPSSAQPKSSTASKTKLPKTTSAKATSSFLPSLTMGGYISGSDSEASDIDVAPSRKNRRGQRERQAIWEKKWGASAKHVQAKNARLERDRGWDARRGAVDDGDERGRGGWKGSRGGGGRRMGNDQRWQNGEGRGRGGGGGVGDGHIGVTKSRDDTGKLHPSWEAAKKRKEDAAKGAAAVKFQGKKVVFD